ncbi:helix-turn-helix domain-containing protein [Microbacterium sp. A8/3-1]|uniref:Helix-turn-helix domain-containing protein n=1 Tax=Microbacterium sp. A8/3-1 TaxID=3160749 RepID=A0AAU7VWP9_9MICO
METAEAASILGRLEGSLLRRLSKSPAAGGLGAVAILERDDPHAIPSGCAVLAVGVTTLNGLEQIIARSQRFGAVAIIVPHSMVESLEGIAESLSDVPLYGLVEGAAWMQVANLLTEAIRGAEIFPERESSGEEVPDLFDLADSLAEVLGEPLTIEDPASRVLAFSRDQSTTDESRRQTVLRMRVPESYRGSTEMEAAVRRVQSSPRPIHITDIDGSSPRWGLRMVAGDEVIGSMWVIKAGELSERQELAWVESARLASLVIVRARIASATARRAREASVAQLIEGGSRARQAASALGFRRDAVIVVAVGARSGEHDVVALAEAERRTRSLQMHLQAVSPRAVAALLGDVTYAIAPVSSPGGQDTFVSFMADFATRFATENPLVVGVGSAVADPNDLARSREEAEGALRVLIDGGPTGRSVATLDDVWVENALLILSDSLAVEHREPTPALRRLRDYDTEHQGALVSTLRAWLDSFGDVAMAAAAVNVHRNTLRYRLTRIEQLGRFSLRDADERLALQLQLRIFDL